jgi:hypothetical protein
MRTSSNSEQTAIASNRTIARLTGLFFKRPKSVEMKLDIIKVFDMFRPRSAGPVESRSLITINTINSLFPLIADLISLSASPPMALKLSSAYDETRQSSILDGLFKKYGSDKSTHHNYHKIYSHIFQDCLTVDSIFEIGLGSRSEIIVSNMGPKGKPGASLRAFRDFFSNAHVMGADIDKEVLFEETRIQTFHLDQLSDDSFQSLLPNLPPQIDLIIDDGLHSPDANIRSILHLAPLLSRSGCMVIEDVNIAAVPIWSVVAHVLAPQFEVTFVDDRDAGVVVIKRHHP